jgi:hypothetical protein
MGLLGVLTPSGAPPLLSTEAKETCYGGKRDLAQRQKRPTMEEKETEYRGKRDLL